MAAPVRMETAGGLVTSQDPRSARAGAEVLAAGGNAVDAAVAAALAIGVLEPMWSGLGGSAWLTIWRGRDEPPVVVEGAGRAPAAATPDMYELDASAGAGGLYGWPAVVGDANVRGASAAYVPGAVAAFCLAQESFGRLPRQRVFEPAIVLAAEGFEVNGYLSGLITQDAPHLRADPGCAELFLPDGLPLRPAGLTEPDVLRQPALADTLWRIARDGRDGFYAGPVATSLAATVAAGGGLLDEDDLRTYEAAIVEPVELDVAGVRVAVPPATGGPTALQALRLFELLGRRWPQAAPAVRWAHALRIAFGDRFAHMSADPHADVPWERLLSEAHAEEAVDALAPPGGAAVALDAPARSGCTSHLNVVDRDGMAVALTSTLLDAFGARVLDRRTGVLLSNGMMWFDPRPGKPNSIRGGAPGLGAASPAIVTRDGALVAAVGATGGRRIISAVAQIVEGVAAGLDAQEAVDRPRLHCEGASVAIDERSGAEAIAALEGAGEPVDVLEETVLTWHFARPNAITVGADGRRTAGLDRLRPAGAAAG